MTNTYQFAKLGFNGIKGQIHEKWIDPDIDASCLVMITRRYQ